MSPTAELVQLATYVPRDLADEFRELAEKAERSSAAELRLAIRAWVEAATEREAAA